MHRQMFATGAPAFALAVGILGFAGTATIANAASYGSFSSASGTVSFLNVSDLNGLFGAPTVVGNVFIDVLEVNGAPVNGLNENAQMVFTQNGQYESNDEGVGTHIWSGFLSIDVNSVITGDGSSGQATLVRISLANTLTAYAASGAAARIEKKDVDGLAITVIPEPGTALLMGLGLIGLAASGRNRAQL